MTFVNAKQEVKTVPLNCPNKDFEITDKSLFKRLQYAKEVLVQMMTGQPLSPTLALYDQSQPKRASSNAEVKSPHTVQAAKIANGGQSSRMPAMKTAKSVGKNLLVSPDAPNSGVK